MILSVALFIASMNVMATIFGKPDSDLGPAGISLNVVEKRHAKHIADGNSGKKKRLNGELTTGDVSGSGGDITGCSSGLLCDTPQLDGWIPQTQRPFKHPIPRHLALAGGKSDSLARVLAPFLERRTTLNDLSGGNSRRSPDHSFLHIPDPPLEIFDPGRGPKDSRPFFPNVFDPGNPPNIPGSGPGSIGGLDPGTPPSAVPLPDGFYPMVLTLILMLSYAFRCKAFGRENTTSSL